MQSLKNQTSTEQTPANFLNYLVEDGFKIFSQSEDRVYLTKPHAKERTSHATYWPSSQRLYVFSDSIPYLTSGKAYNVYTYLKATRQTQKLVDLPTIGKSFKYATAQNLAPKQEPKYNVVLMHRDFEAAFFERKHFTELKNFGNGSTGLSLGYYSLLEIETLLRTNTESNKRKAPAMLKGIYPIGFSNGGEMCSESSPFLFFDIDLKNTEEKQENLFLAIPTERKKVFEALKKHSLLVWSSHSETGIAGILHVPFLQGLENKQKALHLELGKKITEYLSSDIEAKTGIKVIFDDAQSKFRQIRYIARQKQLISLNIDAPTFDIQEQKQVTKIQVNQYLSEAKEHITKALKENNKVLIDAPTGTGKTTFFVQSNFEGIERKILVVPTKLIGEQLSSQYGCLFVSGDSTKKELVGLDNRTLIIATYDSFHKVKTKRTDLVIFDEQHKFVEDQFRNQNNMLSDLYEMIGSIDAKTVFLSGTPIIFGYFKDMQRIEIQPKNAPLVEFHPIIYQGTRSNIFLYTDVQANKFTRKRQNCLVIVRYNDIEALKQRMIFEGLNNSILINNQEPEYKKDPRFIEFQKTGEALKNGIERIYTTSVMDVGFSIKDQVELHVLNSEANERDIVQFCNRGRLTNDNNKTIHCYYYISEKSLQRKEQAKNKPFERIYNEAQEILKSHQCETLKMHFQDSLSSCANFGKIWHDKLYNYALEAYRSQRTPEQLYQDIKDISKGSFKINKAIKHTSGCSSELKTNIIEARQQAIEDKQRVFQAVTQEQALIFVLRYLHSIEGNSDMKYKCAKFLDANEHDRTKIDNCSLFAHADKIPNLKTLKFFAKYFFHLYEYTDSIEGTIDVLANYLKQPIESKTMFSDKNLKVLVNRVQLKYAAKDIDTLWRSKAKKAIKRDVRRGKDMTYYRVKILMLNAGCPEASLHSPKAIEMRLAELYDFSKKKQTTGKKAIVFYDFRPYNFGSTNYESIEPNENDQSFINTGLEDVFCGTVDVYSNKKTIPVNSIFDDVNTKLKYLNFE